MSDQGSLKWRVISGPAAFSPERRACPHHCISWLTNSILLITWQLCLTCFNLKRHFSQWGAVALSLQPNLDYYRKSMADFWQPSGLMKKPSVISTEFTDRLADIWLRQGRGRGSSDELSNVFLPALLISSSPTWQESLKALLSKLHPHDKRAM